MPNKTRSIKKNYFYNLSYQLVMILSPLIVTPYVSRTLGAVETGKYSFTFSIVSIFVLFATLGFNIYGQRLIASCQTNKEEQTKAFWEIVLCKLVCFCAISFIYFIPVVFNLYESKYIYLFFVEFLELIAVLFDISFFFQGNEEFGKIALRSIIVRIIGIVLIFCLVKDLSNLLIYAAIQSGTLVLGNLSLWLYLPKELCKIKDKIKAPLRHLPLALKLFILKSVR